MARSNPHYKPEKSTIDASIIEIKKGEEYKIFPKALSITWGGDERYWHVPKDPKDPVELLQVSWLEVTGTLDLGKLIKNRDYTVSYKISLKPDAFGWADSPVYLMAKPGKSGDCNWKRADLSQLKKPGEPPSEIQTGQKFRVPPNPEGEKLYFGMYEIWKGRWKGGLVLHEVIIKLAN